MPYTTIREFLSIFHNISRFWGFVLIDSIRNGGGVSFIYITYLFSPIGRPLTSFFFSSYPFLPIMPYVNLFPSSTPGWSKGLIPKRPPAKAVSTSKRNRSWPKVNGFISGRTTVWFILLFFV